MIENRIKNLIEYIQQNELIKNLVNYKDFVVLDNKTVSDLILEAVNKINNKGR